MLLHGDERRRLRIVSQSSDQSMQRSVHVRRLRASHKACGAGKYLPTSEQKKTFAYESKPGTCIQYPTPTWQSFVTVSSTLRISSYAGPSLEPSLSSYNSNFPNGVASIVALLRYHCDVLTSCKSVDEDRDDGLGEI